MVSTSLNVKPRAKAQERQHAIVHGGHMAEQVVDAILPRRNLLLQLIVNAEPKPVATFTTSADGELLEAATAEEVVDRLQTVRDYLGSLIERIEIDGDSEVNEALAEALASINMAAAGMWSRK